MRTTKTLLAFCFILLSVHLYAQDVRYFAPNRVFNAINEYQEDGTYIEEFIAADSGGLSNPQDMVLHPNGFLLVTGTNNPQIKSYDALTGDYIGDWSDSTFDLSVPSKMEWGPDGNLYVTQWGTTQETSKIVSFAPDGTFLGPFTPSAPQGLGLTWDENDFLYISLFGITPGSGTVRRYDTDGNFAGIFVDSVILESPASIWFDSNGDFFVQDFSLGKVMRFDSNGDYIDDFIIDLMNPEGHAFLPNGNILICERGANKITEFNPDGSVIGRWDDGGLLGAPSFVRAIDFSTASVNDHTTSAVLVTPTLGTKFNLNPILLSQYSTIEVFDTLGRLVASLQMDETTVLDLSAHATGTYYIQARGNDGQKATQKIMIEK
ncbi:T9SS type A sorting domain-containing protein [Aureisphaera galaxeae]|uniref:T9SS type A sorting domain-containing protein n=1 Tax=Aureisphaera galaxeae TaxID=1538023 RepID=UPI002350D5EC|nr:T9SS type A sorting domain-containing protein [Aureisphaera galaxeae]MDC8005504.1 T9SS type A sorting domain-containing protein [Aureisphaera galaxeae]